MAAALIGAAALTAAACSDDAETSTAASPTSTAAAPTTTAPMDEVMATGTIVDVAVSDPDFSTLVSAIQAAGLAETLNGEGPFTVFAPTNDAFAKIPAATLQSLLEPANKATLTKILTYHVVAAQVMAADVTPGEVVTVEGQPFTVEVEGTDVYIVDGKGGRAQVVTTDVEASNGVIHVIDTVLIPADVTV
jgi:uncharacterized surface protein with fasciclin (FAS1) repeats